MMDPRDLALQRSCPFVSAPMFSQIEPLATGQRMVLGRNGLFLELKTPWLYCCTKVARLPARLSLAFGDVTEELRFSFGVIPLALLDRFIELARAGLPNEVAGAIVYHCENGSLTLRMHEVITASPSAIEYRIAELAADELLAVDLHSHGWLDAFWSATDDRDDQGVRICGVFGRLDRNRPTAKFRVALNGHFMPLPSPWNLA